MHLSRCRLRHCKFYAFDGFSQNIAALRHIETQVMEYMSESGIEAQRLIHRGSLIKRLQGSCSHAIRNADACAARSLSVLHGRQGEYRCSAGDAFRIWVSQIIAVIPFCHCRGKDGSEISPSVGIAAGQKGKWLGLKHAVPGGIISPHGNSVICFPGEKAGFRFKYGLSVLVRKGKSHPDRTVGRFLDRGSTRRHR